VRMRARCRRGCISKHWSWHCDTLKLFHYLDFVTLIIYSLPYHQINHAKYLSSLCTPSATGSQHVRGIRRQECVELIERRLQAVANAPPTLQGLERASSLECSRGAGRPRGEHGREHGP
jgi:hypothetical protein